MGRSTSLIGPQGSTGATGPAGFNGGGYSLNPAAVTGVAATVDGPSGSNDWQVDIVNNSGLSNSFTMYTVCAG
jgi:hypothetical protein